MKFSSAQWPNFSHDGHSIEYSEKQIKNEPMLFSASANFALRSGGPITRQFIRSVLKGRSMEEQKNIVVDSKVCMLMKGWYPCIPGWHHDDVARTRIDKQPDYENLPKTPVKHAMAIYEELYKGPACRTEFLTCEIDLDIPPIGTVIYDVWNKRINDILEHRRKYKDIYVHTMHIPHNDIWYFDSNAFHRGKPARQNGWRFFIRASWNTTRKPLNEIRRNSQIYMSALEAGW